MKRKTIFILVMTFYLFVILLMAGFPLIRGRIQSPPAQDNTPSPVLSNDDILSEDAQTDSSATTMSEDIQPDVPEDDPIPFQAVPVVPDSACFTYEELADGTLRITEYDESKNTQNPYQVIIPSMIDGKPVSTMGTGAIQAHHLIELVISDGITTLENEVFDTPCDMYLVELPNSVVRIDEKAFYNKYDLALPVVISCGSEASYAYQYAVENNYACQLTSPITEENAFLLNYALCCHTSQPYLCHIREEGELYNYVVIEYLDIADNLQMYMNSNRWFSTSYIWDDNEFAILVLEKESGTVLQCIDSHSFHDQEKISLYFLPGVYCQNLLSIADWNFDGIPDICLDQGYDGTGADNHYAVFLFDENSGLYTEADNFPSHNINLRTDKQCIESSAKCGPAQHYIYRYQYIDGELTHVATLSLYDIWEDNFIGTGVRDERLI
ncbi:MAG: hypothetical protein K2H45_02795, partial [Acetatifactor sp.]|nr:hypothetical protein [Acetatifactor sp.]